MIGIGWQLQAEACVVLETSRICGPAIDCINIPTRKEADHSSSGSQHGLP